MKDYLANSHGVYIFYDSRGSALYVGKAVKQSLWHEINNAFNRDRDLQKVVRADANSKTNEFIPVYENPKQPKEVKLFLHELAAYISVYEIDESIIDDIKALIIRSFANDLLNDRIETFKHSRI